jgi:hypothetical protein
MKNASRRHLLIGLLLSGCAASHAQVICEFTPPAGDTIRPGKMVRLGGYFYTGAIDIPWFSSNFDLLSLNAKNDPALVAGLKRGNRSMLVFQQFLANQIAIKQTGAQAAEGFDLDAMGSWLLRKADGVPATPRGPYYLMVDPGKSTQWASHFATYTAKVLAETGADGLNLDEIPLRPNGMFAGLVKYPGAADLQAATSDFLTSIRADIKKPVLINVGELSSAGANGDAMWNTIGRQIDGAWHEGWVRYYGAHEQPHDGQTWEWDIRSAEQFSAAGKPYIASAAFANANELEYGIANYLLATRGPSMVFQPMLAYDTKTRGGFNFELVRQAVETHRPLIDVDIGCPTGPRERNKDGVWIRHFQHGLVVVNPDRGARTVTVSGTGLRDVYGHPVAGPMTLHGFEGRIILNRSAN